MQATIKITKDEMKSAARRAFCSAARVSLRVEVDGLVFCEGDVQVIGVDHIDGREMVLHLEEVRE